MERYSNIEYDQGDGRRQIDSREDEEDRTSQVTAELLAVCSPSISPIHVVMLCTDMPPLIRRTAVLLILVFNAIICRALEPFLQSLRWIFFFQGSVSKMSLAREVLRLKQLRDELVAANADENSSLSSLRLPALLQAGMFCNSDQRCRVKRFCVSRGDIIRAADRQGKSRAVKSRNQS
jgi:hypothetical protein